MKSICKAFACSFSLSVAVSVSVAELSLSLAVSVVVSFEFYLKCLWIWFSTVFHSKTGYLRCVSRLFLLPSSFSPSPSPLCSGIFFWFLCLFSCLLFLFRLSVALCFIYASYFFFYLPRFACRVSFSFEFFPHSFHFLRSGTAKCLLSPISCSLNLPPLLFSPLLAFSLTLSFFPALLA